MTKRTDEEKKLCWQAIVSAANSYKTGSINLHTALEFETIIEIGKRLAYLEEEQAKIEAAKENAEILRLFMLRFWGRDKIEPFCLHLLGDDWQMLKTNAEKLAALVLALFKTAGYDNMRAGPIREEVERIAALLAPPLPEPAPFAPGVHVITLDENSQAHFGPVVDGTIEPKE